MASERAAPRESPSFMQSNPNSPESSKAVDIAAPVFEALLTPHRSLSRRGLALLFSFFILVGLATSIPFFLLGAWPVLGFMGLEIGLVYVSFRYHNATARAYEEIILSRLELLFRSVSWRGQIREARFNPAWTRLERDVHPEFGIEKLEIVQGRQRVEVAASLGREARGEFADAFQRALSDARR